MCIPVSHISLLSLSRRFSVPHFFGKVSAIINFWSNVCLSCKLLLIVCFESMLFWIYHLVLPLLVSLVYNFVLVIAAAVLSCDVCIAFVALWSCVVVWSVHGLCSIVICSLVVLCCCVLICCQCSVACWCFSHEALGQFLPCVCHIAILTVFTMPLNVRGSLHVDHYAPQFIPKVGCD